MLGPIWQRTCLWADLWFSSRMMPWRVRRRPLRSVLRLAEPSTTSRYAGFSAAYISRAVERVTRHPWLMRDRRCLRRGLLGFRFLSEAGFDPELHFGVDSTSIASDPLVAHCWVSIDGAPVISDRLQGMATVLVHSRQGFAPRRA